MTTEVAVIVLSGENEALLQTIIDNNFRGAEATNNYFKNQQIAGQQADIKFICGQEIEITKNYQNKDIFIVLVDSSDEISKQQFRTASEKIQQCFGIPLIVDISTTPKEENIEEIKEIIESRFLSEIDYVFAPTTKKNAIKDVIGGAMQSGEMQRKQDIVRLALASGFGAAAVTLQIIANISILGASNPAIISTPAIALFSIMTGGMALTYPLIAFVTLALIYFGYKAANYLYHGYHRGVFLNDKNRSNNSEQENLILRKKV